MSETQRESVIKIFGPKRYLNEAARTKGEAIRQRINLKSTSATSATEQAAKVNVIKVHSPRERVNESELDKKKAIRDRIKVYLTGEPIPPQRNTSESPFVINFPEDSENGFKAVKDIFDPNKKIKLIPTTGIEIPQDWNLIPKIGESRGIPIDASKDLIQIVELPLYQASRKLYDAGVRTTESNAHFEGNEKETFIGLVIDTRSLNDDQKAYAEQLVRKIEPNETSPRWRIIPAVENPDGYEALELHWIIQKDKVSPVQVSIYATTCADEFLKRRLN